MASSCSIKEATVVIQKYILEKMWKRTEKKNSVVKDVVMSLMEPYLDSGKILYTANFYTCILLIIEDLLEIKHTLLELIQEIKCPFQKRLQELNY